MTLREYIDTRGVSVPKLAKLAGCSKQTLYQLLGGATPTIQTAVKIEGATHGLVTPADFLTVDHGEASA